MPVDTRTDQLCPAGSTRCDEQVLEPINADGE